MSNTFIFMIIQTSPNHLQHILQIFKPSTTRQTYLHFGKTRQRLNQYMILYCLSEIDRQLISIRFVMICQALLANRNIEGIMQRTMHVMLSHFKLNSYTDLEIYKTLRFKREDRGKIVNVFNWNSGVTEGKGMYVIR